MVPQPRKQNPQRQPLTVSLRKICRDYPAGAGILKELLQNADDAGASTVKFVLDTSTHPDSPLLVDGLSEYQGPALLAYNNALFTERDFESLTSLGDSKKIQDKAATGKFGLGFSSVFNWTDCPSIVSGSTLLLLDPHSSWSKGFDPPGGPVYDFTASAEDEAMINQLACFSLLNKKWKDPFEGTIIRIPLRNAAQAVRSEISKTETTKNDVQDAIDSFAKDMGSNGLLFLKSVRHIVLSVNGEQVNEVEIINRHDLAEPKQCLENLLVKLMHGEDPAGGELYHEVHLRHRAAGQEIVKMFGVLNLVAGTIHDHPLKSWAASEKLFPWVAVAAPIKGFDSGGEEGRLFSTLPLPCSTGLSAHIHGLFSTTADRSRLHGLDDSGVQDHRPKEWNKILFDRLIPKAWAKLLLNICQTHPAYDHSHLWPRKSSDPRQLWDGMCHSVMDEVFQNHMPVWFTGIGYVAIEDGLLALQETQLSMRRALCEARLPIIFAVAPVLSEACQIAGSRALNTRTLMQQLQRMENVSSLSSESRLVLLEYLLPDIPLTDFGALEIFPFRDGKFHSLKIQPVFLDRDDFEKTLFAKQRESCIDAARLSETASAMMHERVRQDNHIVRYRDPDDLRDYYLKYIARGSGDTIELDEDGMTTLSQVWRWILQHSTDRLPLLAIGSLWLVPLRGSKIRKLVPSDNSNFVTWFRPGEVKDVALKIFASNPVNAPNVLADEALGDEFLRRLLGFSSTEQSLCIKEGNKFGDFLEFLAQGRGVLQTGAEDIKYSTLRVLEQCWSRTEPSTARECNLLKSLCLFRAVQWPVNTTDTSLTRYWTHKSSDFTFIGLKTLIPVPSSPKQVFIDATNEGERAFFERLGLLECLSDLQILEEIVIPAMRSDRYNLMCPNFRLEVVKLLFESYYRISPAKRSFFPDLAIVPLERRRDDGNLRFGRPLDVLDPQQQALRDLYFEDEVHLPEPQFYNDFSAVLGECGMVKFLNDRVVLNRIYSYARKQLDFGSVALRAKHLLQMPYQRNSGHLDLFIQVARDTKWLPAQNPDKSDSLTAASRCLDKSDELLVGYVWHVLPFVVDRTWRSILGWRNQIELDVLMSQLAASINACDIPSVERTLSYIYQQHSTKDFADRLLELNFVLSSNGELVDVSKVCRRGGERLVPYLHTVEPRFWKDHSQIMKLTSIAETPKLDQLRNVLNSLDSRNPLNEEDLDVAVEVARIWGAQFPESVHGLKVPDTNRVLAGVGDLVFNDTPWVSAGERASVHPKVSRVSAEQLKIEPLSELVRNGDLGITDPDDDEFYQREEVADGIRDTLDRYTRQATFHEYLANADDCGSATEVNFLFDGANYGKKHLLTKELQDLQGPSLLIHNNGVFTDKDFEGLKHVGRGSKRDDSSTIGKFGRGSQTMFHWTDLPMILSGRYLLILDPLRRYLSYNYRARQKKAGILLEYSNLKATCRDQLAPFEGLWGFDSDQDSYHGTIFRFPLRDEGQSSELLESQLCPDVSTTIDMFLKSFDDARLALLFLRNLTTIDFSVKRGDQFEWRVSRGTWPQNGIFSDWAHVLVEKQISPGKNASTVEQWWRAIVDVDDAPADLQHRHKRRMKDVECGIAALVPQAGKSTRSCLQPLRSRFFNCLPLKFESALPVHIQATFLLSGDRQNIAIEETSQDAGSEWNRWLLQKKLPHVYLQFLEDIGRKIGHDVYKYFPLDTNGAHMLSDLITASFWTEIQSSSCRLFPVVEASQGSWMPGNTGRSVRRAPNMVTFQEATFDFLERQMSDTLRPLLCKCLEHLVRPPLQFNKHINCAGVKVLTPGLVRCVLKSDKVKEHIERAKEAEKNFLSNLLSYIMPPTKAEVIELDGCPILPLANGSLGTLSLKSSSTDSCNVMYFSADPECHNLFSFASSLLAASQVHKKFVDCILSSGLFNLKSLEKTDVSVVLRCNIKESWAPGPMSKAWLLRFWKYMNSTSRSTGEPTKPEVLNLDSLQHLPLLLLRHHNGKETMNSLHHFQNNPVVVQVNVEEHMKLLADFPGLDIVDSGTLPESVCRAEESLSDKASLNRFLKSIELLAVRDGKSLSDFVRENVKDRNIRTLRDILLKISHRLVFTNVLLPDQANNLPVWPRISSQHGYLTAREAIAAQNIAFVVPWIKDYHLFTEINHFHRSGSINDVEMLRSHVLPALPDLIDKQYKAPYCHLVEAIASSSSLKENMSKNTNRRYVMPLNTHRLAARQDGTLCLASDLFDHNDTIFLAAFRLESRKRFLMLEAQTQNSLWRELGIRRRQHGKFNGADYVSCLRALERRMAGLHDQDLVNDTKTVLYPLCTSDGTLSDLDFTMWTTISSLPVFPLSPVSEHEPGFRKPRMELISSRRCTLSLRDIVRQEFAAVCWSQTPFTLHEPSMYSIRRIGSQGQPTCAMVWRHLAFMAKFAQHIDEADVENFIDDLQRTYEFLLLNIQESKTTFNKPEAAVWFNIETTTPSAVSLDVLKTSWTSLENLLLDSPCHSPPLMMVQPFLGRFSTLLKEIGCRRLYYPPVTVSSADRTQTTFDFVRELWKDGILTDVMFQAEGNTIAAHKIILASRSSYCKTQFSGSWATRVNHNDTNEVIELKEMTYATLQIMIEFCYNETHDWAVGMQVNEGDSLSIIADKLDCLFDVLAAADRWLVPDLHADAQRHILCGAKYFVRPDNVKYVQKVASDSRAPELEDFCQKFSDENPEAVLLAS